MGVLFLEIINIRGGHGPCLLLPPTPPADRARFYLIKNSPYLNSVPRYDEHEIVLFFIFRHDSKYVQLQRDIENKIVPVPLTLDEAVSMAKNRVEVTKKAHETVAPVSIFTTVARDIPATNIGTKTLGPSAKSTSGHAKRADHKRGFQKLGPLVPYPHTSHLE